MAKDDLKIIKKKLINEDKIPDLLKALDCEYVTREQSGRLFTAQLPERFGSTNKRSVQVKTNDSLSTTIRSRGEFNGDNIFHLVSYLKFNKKGSAIGKDLHNAKEFICRRFGWDNFLSYNEDEIYVKDFTSCLKELLHDGISKIEIIPNPVLSESTLKSYIQLPYEGWIDEGISYSTQVEFGIGFDLESKRITIPMRNQSGELVGVKGRIMKDKDDPERKYLYLHKFNNRYEWFNFHRAKEHILKEKKVYIFEAEKSPMKAYEYGYFNTLGIGSSDITIEQAQILKELGEDIDIILCYDQGIEVNDIERASELFEGWDVYGMYDIDGLLGDKDAPVDRGKEIWTKLVKDYVFKI